jgi:ribosomal protein S18 acetylase RimI-like enzyme
MGLADSVAIRPAIGEDVERVAHLHATSIVEGFLPSLGSRFLCRLYRRVIRSPHGFLLASQCAATPGVHAEGDELGPISGFVAGATNVRQLYREFIVRDGVAAAISSAGRLARSVPRAVETLRYGSGDPLAGEHDNDHGSAELLALAVDGAHRNRGIGASLVQAFLVTASEAGSSSARVVVGRANSGAIRLYRDAGFEPGSTLELHAGTPSLVLWMDLPAAPSS